MAKIKKKGCFGKKIFPNLFNYDFKLAKKLLKKQVGWLWLLFLLLLVAAIAITQSPTKTSNLSEAFNKVKKKLAKRPTDPQLHFQLSQIYKEANNWQKAKEEIAQALQYEPTNQEWRKTLEEIKKQEQKPQEIKEEIAKWENIVSYFPNYRDAWFKLSLLYWQIFQEEKAKTALRKTQELDPNFQPAQILKEWIKN